MDYDKNGAEFGHIVHGEVRAVDGAGDDFVIEGIAAVFNKWADLGPIRERIKPGAFSEALGSSDVRLLVNHSGLPLARTTSGTMTLEETSRGLEFEARLDPTDPDVRAVIPKLRRGDLSQMSFAFDVGEDGQTWKGNDRTLTKVSELFDVSLVTFPAYESARVTGLRALQKFNREVATSDLKLSDLRETMLKEYFG